MKMLCEILKASKGILVADFYADLWANIAGGGTPVDVFVEMIGSLPLYYNGKGYDLTDYLISGNAVQDGTPSSDAPVDATGSGVRTGNLAYGRINGVNISPNGIIVRVGGYDIAIGRVESGMVYTVNSYVLAFYANEPTISSVSYDNSRIVGTEGEPSTFTAPITGYIAFRLDSGEQAMLNLGSTALPYEPYGFKLPLTVNGAEYPIHLGTVPTTRRVKKLVLTGKESWSVTSAQSKTRAIANFTTFLGLMPLSRVISTHYKGVEGGAAYPVVNTISINSNGTMVIGITSEFTDANAFKSYLAAQYAAGHPVTVWCVLAEPETAVVNEPLMKIGDYADTVSFAQSQVTIPTVSGANVLDMTAPVKPSEVYIKGKGIKPTGYGQLSDVNGVNILDKDGRPVYVHGQ